MFPATSKAAMLDLLLADPDIHDEVDQNWEMILTMISKIRSKNREKFLISLREKLMPDEIDLIAPELKKYRGKAFSE
jgi:hypothetical protein